jgi:hypothetical protein
MKLGNEIELRWEPNTTLMHQPYMSVFQDNTHLNIMVQVLNGCIPMLATIDLELSYTLMIY